MFLNLNPSSGIPIYRQMLDQLRQRIAGGQLPAGSPLPSVRELSRDLKVNPLTVAKVYQFLEAEGLVETRRGLGTYVAAHAVSRPANRARLLGPALEQLMTEAAHLGLNAAEVQELVRHALQKNRQRLKGE